MVMLLILCITVCTWRLKYCIELSSPNLLPNPCEEDGKVDSKAKKEIAEKYMQKSQCILLNLHCNEDLQPIDPYLEPTLIFHTSPWLAIMDYRSLRKTPKLSCTDDCYSGLSPDQIVWLQPEKCFFSPLAVFINTTVLNLLHLLPSLLLLSLR